MTNTPPNPNGRPASILRRLAAMVYDGLLLLSILLLATLAVLPLSGGEAIFDNRLHRALYQAYLLLICFFYFAWHWVRKGQTLGMRAWHLRLVQDSGEPLTWWHALLRFMLAIVSFMPLGIGFFWIVVNRDRATWYDRGSGTKMVLALPRRMHRKGSPTS